ncbi:unnamed protein product [Boreogadus saida]
MTQADAGLENWVQVIGGRTPLETWDWKTWVKVRGQDPLRDLGLETGLHVRGQDPLENLGLVQVRGQDPLETWTEDGVQSSGPSRDLGILKTGSKVRGQGTP